MDNLQALEIINSWHGEDGESDQTIELASKALEKQIAEKLNNGLCPTCNTDIMLCSDCGDLLYIKHCMECSQALDWTGYRHD
jgi:hypothetical protein